MENKVKFNVVDNGDYISIGKCTTQSKVVAVPNKINGKPVLEVLPKAFTGLNSVEKIILPDTIKSIGELAFSNCPNLQEVKLPKNIDRISNKAFSNCPKLFELYLDTNSFENISVNSFKNINDYFTLCIPQQLQSNKELIEKLCYESGMITISGDSEEYVKTGYNHKYSPYGKNILLSKEGFYYFLDANNKAVITCPPDLNEYHFESDNLRIPEFVDEYTVSAIGARAFSYGTYNIIELPKKLDYIASEAFYHVSFELLILPEFLGEFGDYPIVNSFDFGSMLINSISETKSKSQIIYLPKIVENKREIKFNKSIKIARTNEVKKFFNCSAVFSNIKYDEQLGIVYTIKNNSCILMSCANYISENQIPMFIDGCTVNCITSTFIESLSQKKYINKNKVELFYEKYKDEMSIEKTEFLEKINDFIKIVNTMHFAKRFGADINLEENGELKIINFLIEKHTEIEELYDQKRNIIIPEYINKITSIEESSYNEKKDMKIVLHDNMISIENITFADYFIVPTNMHSIKRCAGNIYVRFGYGNNIQIDDETEYIKGFVKLEEDGKGNSYIIIKDEQTLEEYAILNSAILIGKEHCFESYYKGLPIKRINSFNCGDEDVIEKLTFDNVFFNPQENYLGIYCEVEEFIIGPSFKYLDSNSPVLDVIPSDTKVIRLSEGINEASYENMYFYNRAENERKVYLPKSLKSIDCQILNYFRASDIYIYKSTQIVGSNFNGKIHYLGDEGGTTPHIKTGTIYNNESEEIEKNKKVLTKIKNVSISSIPDTIYKRGLNLYNEGGLYDIEVSGYEISAYYMGTSDEPYRINISLDYANKLYYFCTCPSYQGSGYRCKHIVALIIYVKNHYKELLPVDDSGFNEGSNETKNESNSSKISTQSEQTTYNTYDQNKKVDVVERPQSNGKSKALSIVSMVLSLGALFWIFLAIILAYNSKIRIQTLQVFDYVPTGKYGSRTVNLGKEAGFFFVLSYLGIFICTFCAMSKKEYEHIFRYSSLGCALLSLITFASALSSNTFNYGVKSYYPEMRYGFVDVQTYSDVFSVFAMILFVFAVIFALASAIITFIKTKKKL